MKKDYVETLVFKNKTKTVKAKILKEQNYLGGVVAEIAEGKRESTNQWAIAELFEYVQKNKLKLVKCLI